ncbi:MAG: PTS sugar transporter subunit IIA [Bacteroidetes bacterium]|nr:PTS sugar transporter subunit IIA [Bacteroidota bacterium]
MKIADLINERNIDLSLSADSEIETILSMVELASHCQKVEDSGALAQSILHYEVIAPSFTGSCGVVFHSLSDGISAPKIFFGRFDKGIGYQSKAGRPIDLVFLIAAPIGHERELVDIFERLDHLLQQPPIRELLRSPKSPEEILQVLIRHLDLKEEPISGSEVPLNQYAPSLQ